MNFWSEGPDCILSGKKRTQSSMVLNRFAHKHEITLGNYLKDGGNIYDFLDSGLEGFVKQHSLAKVFYCTTQIWL